MLAPVPFRPALVALAALLLPLSGCVADIHIEYPAADDDTGDDDDATDDDDDTGDDDATDDDDDTGDDDDATDDDDDTGDDMSYWTGARVLHLDFSGWAESQWGVVDCDAPYEMVGPNVTGTTQDLCPVCAFVFQISHNPDPPDQVEECVSQANMSGMPFERLYGLQMSSETEFILWRSEDADGELQPYGAGSFDDDGALSYTTEPDDYGWMTLTVEGEGTFGS